MKAEIADKLRKAEQALDGARKIAAIGLPAVAAREAYVALFHAAQAVLVSRGIAAKSHSGVRGEFGRLALSEPGLGENAGRLLTDACRFKEISDYRTDRAVEVSEAANLIGSVADALERISALLAD